MLKAVYINFADNRTPAEREEDIRRICRRIRQEEKALRIAGKDPSKVKAHHADNIIERHFRTGVN